jgi:hypothetical protein
MAYSYNGTELDAHLPAPEYVPTRPSCGKRSGYVIHRQRGEDACVPCMDAAAAYQRAWSAAKKVAA